MRGTISAFPRALAALLAAFALATAPALAGGPVKDPAPPTRSGDDARAAARFDNADDSQGALHFRDMPAAQPQARLAQDAEDEVQVEAEVVCRYTTDELVVIYVGLVFAFLPGIVAAHMLC